MAATKRAKVESGDEGEEAAEEGARRGAGPSGRRGRRGQWQARAAAKQEGRVGENDVDVDVKPSAAKKRRLDQAASASASASASPSNAAAGPSDGVTAPAGRANGSSAGSSRTTRASQAAVKMESTLPHGRAHPHASSHASASSALPTRANGAATARDPDPRRSSKKRGRSAAMEQDVKPFVKREREETGRPAANGLVNGHLKAEAEEDGDEDEEEARAEAEAQADTDARDMGSEDETAEHKPRVKLESIPLTLRAASTPASPEPADARDNDDDLDADSPAAKKEEPDDTTLSDLSDADADNKDDDAAERGPPKASSSRFIVKSEPHDAAAHVPFPFTSAFCPPAPTPAEDEVNSTRRRARQQKPQEKAKEKKQEEMNEKRKGKKDKGKQRAENQDDIELERLGNSTAGIGAQNGQGDGHAAHVERLEEELRQLKAELESKNATLRTQSEALDRVTESFNCNVCLETLRNPLALACGHVFCQDDLWNWFHRVDAESNDEDSDSDEESDGDDDNDDDDDDSSSDESDESQPIPAPGFGATALREHQLERERVQRETEEIEDYSSDGGPRRVGARVTSGHASTSASAADDSGDDASEGEGTQDETQRVAESSGPPAHSLATVGAARRARGGGPGSSAAGAPRRSVALRPAPTAGPSTSRALATHGRVQRIRLPSVGSDLLPPEGDYNTDDSLTDADSSSEDTQTQTQVRPAQRRTYQRDLAAGPAPPGPPRESARQRIATRASGTALHSRQRQLAAPAAPARPVGAAADNAVGQRPAVAAGNGDADAVTQADTNANAEAPTTRRVKARKHPKKSNLVCPQCRTRVVIPPFPIFMLRELGDAAQVHANGRRLASVERERGEDVLDDTTWGGLFPRAAAAGTNAGRRDGQRPPSVRYDFSDDSSSSDSEESELMAEPARMVASEDEDPEMQAILRRGREYARHVDEAMAEADRRAVPDAIARRGQLRREEREHARVVDRMRQRELDRLLARIDERRRIARLSSRNAESSAWAAAHNAAEARTRAREDEEVAQLTRELFRERSEQAERERRNEDRREVLSRGMVDREDGVRRCIDCGWEIEDGKCEQCGITYDSDSEYDNSHDDVGGTSQTRPEGGEGEDEDLSDFVVPDDEEFGRMVTRARRAVDQRQPHGGAVDSEADLAESTAPVESEDVKEEEAVDGQPAETHVNAFLRRTMQRRRPTSAESDAVKDEDADDESGEDLMDDPDDQDGDALPPVKEEDGDEGSASQAPGNSQARRQRTSKKRSLFMYDSEDEGADAEQPDAEDDDGFFVNEGDEDMDGQATDIDESEAESTDKETKRVRREERRLAKEAARLARPAGAADPTSDFSEEDSETSTEDEDEDEEDEDIPEISSQQVQRERQANGNGRSQAANQAARAALARNARQADAMSAFFEQRVQAAGGGQLLGSSTQGGHAAAKPTKTKRRIIEDSDEDE